MRSQKMVSKVFSSGKKFLIGIDVPIIDPKKKLSDADFEALLPHFFFEARDALFSGPQPRIVLGWEKMEEIIETKIETGPEEAKLKPKLELEEDGDEIEIVTEIVEKKPSRVDLKDSSGSEDKLLNIFLADSSNAVSHFLDNSIA